MSRATSLLVAHFALQNTASNSAEKKNRPREGVAEGGFGGNSATPERNQIVDNPAVLLVKSRTPHKSFLFLLEEKNRRAQIKKCSNFVQKTPQNPPILWVGFYFLSLILQKIKKMSYYKGKIRLKNRSYLIWQCQNLTV